MEYQLREYDVKEGELADFVGEWREKIRPLRLKFGFRVVGAWFVESENKFFWIIGWDGPKGSFKEADSKYATSPDRKSIEPNPARHLKNIREVLMSSVLP